ncbi:unnamed protein product [Protopolystoma xenopodis]|uniref:Folliculin DENN domain-containing protein n=1 Tax=Protopolystoma xenopodis TaxID=117903 RepID=A0A448X0J3_9PLAT|nr:unnamed protein product [Protopolystoma xenopodis]
MSSINCDASFELPATCSAHTNECFTVGETTITSSYRKSSGTRTHRYESDKCLGYLETNDTTSVPPRDSGSPKFQQRQQTQPPVASARQGGASSASASNTTSSNSSPMRYSAYVRQVIQLLDLQPALPPQAMDLALIALRQEWINKARLLYAFKRCQGPNLSGADAKRKWDGLLAAIGCSAPEDSAVAVFWQGALSQQSRANVCHIRRGRPATTSGSTVTSSSSNLAINSALTNLSVAINGSRGDAGGSGSWGQNSRRISTSTSNNLEFSNVFSIQAQPSTGTFAASASFSD